MCISSIITSVQSAKRYLFFFFFSLEFAALIFNHTQALLFGYTFSVISIPFGVFVSCGNVTVLLPEVSIAALIRGYNVFIYYNNKHSCKVDYKNK